MGLDVYKIEFGGNEYLPLDMNNTRCQLIADMYKEHVTTEEVEYFNTTDLIDTVVVDYDSLRQDLKDLVDVSKLNDKKTVLARHDPEYTKLIDIVCVDCIFETEYSISFKEIEYVVRKTHNQKLYDNFTGDCWYSGESTKLEDKNTRHIVMIDEFDELKKCFNNSPIHSIEWDNPKHFILLDL